jgi:hypothetical protein
MARMGIGSRGRHLPLWVSGKKIQIGKGEGYCQILIPKFELFLKSVFVYSEYPRAIRKVYLDRLKRKFVSTYSGGPAPKKK